MRTYSNHRFTRYLIIVLVSIGIGVAAVYYFSQDEPRTKRVVVAVKAMEEIEFWRVLIDGVNTAAREFGVEVTVIGPPREVEVDLQIELLEAALQQQPDAIVMAAGDFQRLVPVTEAIREANIPLVMIDSAVEGKSARSLIATDNYNAGQKAGQELAALLPPTAKVAIVSFVQGTSTQIDRELGVRSVFEEIPGTEIVGTFYSEGMESVAYDVTKELLHEHPDLDGIVSLNEPSTVGAGRVIRELDLIGDVKLVGFDSSIKEVKLLEEGVLQSIVVQKPFSIGYLGLKTAVSVIDGAKVPPLIHTDSVVINKENMYFEENQKLLFPFVEE
ncbi:hypothetical protein JCM10914A_52360 [Paenibacillus sp. JCM 10914]|uniref:substrate-binding domain-containing protein n=1 Tax=Paenibacillus sp. JCM 10914 TaxID=1236974 RepID=UPI0003CC3074|nr:substrate-binding domain-containing protein [Paenibacillus sp. JCM 10914]GAE05051.1 periplasmic binding protein/LacI transcriptional regulator [Paenibacillus sp. JCM 10914]